MQLLAFPEHETELIRRYTLTKADLAEATQNISPKSRKIFSQIVTLHEIRRLASRCASRESLILVQFCGCTKRGDHCTLIGDFVRAYAVSHLGAKYWEPTRRTKTLVHIPQVVQI